MVPSPTQYPTLDELIKKCLRTKVFKEELKRFIEPLYESCKKGNESWDRQKAYIGLQRQLPLLERAFVEVFNDLTYRKR